MTDTYRLPDNPLARALQQARTDLARQRAEQDERDRANAAAIEDLRAMLAALNPPLVLRMEPERGLRYEGQDPPVWAVAWAPTAAEGCRACRIEEAATNVQQRVGSVRFAEQIEALLEQERAAIARAAQRALEPPPEIAPATRPSPAQVSPEAWRAQWAVVGCAVGWCGLLIVALCVVGPRAIALPITATGGLLGAVLGYLLAPDQRAWREAADRRRERQVERRLARLRAVRAALRERWPPPPAP